MDTVSQQSPNLFKDGYYKSIVTPFMSYVQLVIKFHCKLIWFYYQKNTKDFKISKTLTSRRLLEKSPRNCMDTYKLRLYVVSLNWFLVQSSLYSIIQSRIEVWLLTVLHRLQIRYLTCSYLKFKYFSPRTKSLNSWF